MSNKANKTIETLHLYESRNVTFIDPDGSWPIVWERAKGMRVWDDAGREYLDFTAAFGVAAVGHANPRIVAAGQRQMARLLHAMGDVHPHALKAELARELSRLTFERLAKRTGKTVFCNSGFEAVEAALKTAHLATGRPLPSPLMTVPSMAKFRPSIWPASSSRPSRTASRMRVLLTAWPSSVTACRPCT